MYFASDNAGPAHPKVIEAIAEANQGYMGSYGADPIMDRVRARIRDLFEAPEAAVYLVATGTAANSLALASFCQPFQTVFCSPMAHINVDECNAPEFYTGGAKLTLVDAPDGRIDAHALRSAIAAEGNRGVHGPARGPLSITQVTELGTIYEPEAVAGLAAIAKAHDLPVHMDGARFANAIVAGEATPAEMTWKAGVDVLSFGGTKNGLMGVEAVVIFDPAKAWEFELRRKRGAHLFSKHRYLSAQMEAYLEGDLWREMALSANAANARLAAGLRAIEGIDFVAEPEANMTFATAPRALVKRLSDGGAVFHVTQGSLDGDDPQERLTIRLVCDWSIGDDAIDAFLALAAG